MIIFARLNIYFHTLVLNFLKILHHAFVHFTKTNMYNLDLLKKEYIGKEFYWLTVIDVVKDVGRPIEFICKCRCGNEITRRWDKIKSGHTKSCGCYRKSSEMAEYKSQWFKDNPEKVRDRSEKYSKWCKDNPDKVIEKSNKHRKYNEKHPEVLINQGRKISQWNSDNPDKVAERGKKMSLWYKENPDKVAERSVKHSQWFKDHHDEWVNSYNKRLTTYENNPEISYRSSEKYSQWCKNNTDKVKNISNQGNAAYVLNCALRRQSIDYSVIDSIVRHDFVERLHRGEIKFNDFVFISCCTCGEYFPIKLGHLLNTNGLINNRIHLCSKCRHTASSYEQEIADFVLTFYSGECIRNTRDIISPLELDLYYPEKKIAIEFNGDYWHSELFKDKEYHYNKFYRCLEHGVILVSIFNYYWHRDNDKIKVYLLDLFKGRENSLSFDRPGYINNNYPTPYMSLQDASYNINYYEFCDSLIYTCGYSLLHL